MSAQQRGGNTEDGVAVQPWTEAFAAQDPEAFAAAFAEDVVLEASGLRVPVTGREDVARVMGAASGIYESLVFTHETASGTRRYLEWEATALGGVALSGCTILTTGDDGRIVRAVIQHRPLDGLLAFSAELGRRLAGVVAPVHFHPAG
ncbi:nuclear transport factor 2 family protein [Streptantibioticus cattleyicolor]|uniref:Alpha/beta fold family hydrolase n=1 Tax=Streptantibioticus cattleyicolor (strain ATCC 35852 / DSM 46488 / JCM 4925 / NBRC 14057 / NRRL 8057) TaxID=1003195 RepID=F8JM88_STREN|nr:nuclear transport factor 2 family protein [Streptantibioticus cattleyicolor]AEW99580.1 alpha/beta fold family hydrolase [Streptantibioticus cattleyicolor NRRL 8057 = DSM 46488]CCB71383.1 conserved protein of unknown function [Streptantibioticus cattleyicolor NRRL 8057 = DSM 46488]